MAILKLGDKCCERSAASVHTHERRSREGGEKSNAESDNKKRKLETKDYSAAKECLKYIPPSMHNLSQKSTIKAKLASSISACPTPVKVNSSKACIWIQNLLINLKQQNKAVTECKLQYQAELTEIQPSVAMSRGLSRHEDHDAVSRREMEKVPALSRIEINSNNPRATSDIDNLQIFQYQLNKTDPIMNKQNYVLQQSIPERNMWLMPSGHSVSIKGKGCHYFVLMTILLLGRVLLVLKTYLMMSS